MLCLVGSCLARMRVAGWQGLVRGTEDDGGHGPLWLGSVCQAQSGLVGVVYCTCPPSCGIQYNTIQMPCRRAGRCHEVGTDWRPRRIRSQYCSNTCATPPF